MNRLKLFWQWRNSNDDSKQCTCTQSSLQWRIFSQNNRIVLFLTFMEIK